MCYKDAANEKSNQKNLGVIQSSNLCTEIMEYTAPDEVAVCNLASLALPRYVTKDGKGYDFEKLHEVTKEVCKGLNKIIDVNYRMVLGFFRAKFYFGDDQNFYGRRNISKKTTKFFLDDKNFFEDDKNFFRRHNFLDDKIFR